MQPKMDRRTAMGNQPITRLLLKFSGPGIISMVVATSYNVVDAMYVGRLGPDALAALTVSFPLMMIFMALGRGTGSGAASLISRRLGAADHQSANRGASVAVTLSLLLGAVMVAVCLPNIEAIVMAFGAFDSVVPLSVTYLSILISFAPVTMFLLIMGTVIRAEGNPLLSSFTTIASALINIVLDPVLIFGLGPIPPMGVAGAAIATVIARAAAVVVFLLYFLLGKSSYHFRLSYFLPSARILGEIYRVGTASIVRMSAGSVSLILASRIAASFGVIPLAVLGVINRLVRLSFGPCRGLGEGMLPLVGYNFGAGQKGRVGEAVSKTSLAAFLWSIVCGTTFFLLPGPIIGIFNNQAAFRAVGIPALRIYSLGLFSVGLSLVLSFFFQGIGRGRPALILAGSRQLFFLIPALLILPRVFGSSGLWAAFPVADCLALALSLTWTAIEFRKQEIRFSFKSERKLPRV